MPTGPRAAAAPSTGLRLVRAERRTFTGPAEFLSDPAERADLDTYLADLTRPYPPGSAPVPAPLGQSYGEMAEALIAAVVPAGEPVDLLVLAFAIHDMQPGRATATYLSHICPGTPMAFAICDQGSAAAYSGLRIARDYPSLAGSRRSLLIVVEQSELPYGGATARPARHRGVAMLFQGDPAPAASGPAPGPRLVALRQRPKVAPEAVAGQLHADLAELPSGGREVRVVASPALAAAWPEHRSHRVIVGPDAQPSTGIWWQLLDELDAGTAGADLLVAADYDPDLGYLCLAALEPAAASQPATNSSSVRPAVPE